MINVIDLLVVLNSVILLGVCVVYFRKNYVIMDMDSYNTIIDYVEQTKNKEDEVPELEGGTGFFKEYVEEDEEE